MKFKILFGVCMTFNLCRCIAQQGLSIELKFVDLFGNVFILENVSSLPKILDSVFWKNEMNEKVIDSKANEQKRPRTYVIRDVKQKKREKIYEFHLSSIPEGESIEEMMSHTGWSVYKMVITKAKSGKYKILSVTYLSGEI